MLKQFHIFTFGLALLAGPAAAQQWSPWDGEPFWERSQPLRQPDSGRTRRDRSDIYGDQYFDEGEPNSAPQPLTFDGGGRPYIEPVEPETVAFPYTFPARSIVIDNASKKLYFVLDGGQAYAYPISIGREGFSWTGTEKITRKQDWPDWHPPVEMRKRDPKLPEKMTGGLRNPLGAMALYLGNTLYRIHGTNDPKTIGRASSSGCFRMLNANVLHLASVAGIGTQVSVVMRLPAARMPEVAQLQPPPPPRFESLRMARPRVETPRVAPDDLPGATARPRGQDLFDDEDTYEYVDGAYRRVERYPSDPYFDEPPPMPQPYRRAWRDWRDPYER